MEQKLQELKRRDSLAELGGGKERQERQHKDGKMSARERIEFLLDEGTFEEFDKMVTHKCTDFGMEHSKIYGDGFVTGYGRIEERLPVSGRTFMYGVGVIEMLVGLGILTKQPKLASYTASAWLLGIAGNLALNGDYDVAVRDVNMALAAYALARSESSRENARTIGSSQEDAVLKNVA